MEGFRFSNIAEVKYFLKYIDKRVSTPLIPDEIWEEAKRATFELYNNSQCLPYLRRCIELFEQIYRAKYRTDLWEFVFESYVEDFCDVSNAEVVVSTIHKAKGREFDDVYMLISDTPYKDDKLFRQYYVGITRAKNRLFIHTNSDIFSKLPADKYYNDNKQYPMPEEIVLQMSHKDVFLDFFKNIKRDVLALRSGDPLILEEPYFMVPSNHRAVAKLSTGMQNVISSWKEKGYSISSASVRFVVAWKPKDASKEEAESAVLLIDVVLTQR
jgi:ATP-dependent DNA helicase RecQ